MSNLTLETFNSKATHDRARYVEVLSGHLLLLLALHGLHAPKNCLGAIFDAFRAAAAEVGRLHCVQHLPDVCEIKNIVG